jgi:zinc/manganese transport system permease protein
MVLVAMLAFGAAFLSQSSQYEDQIFSLLFGEILGVSAAQLVPVIIVGVASMIALATIFRPLLLSSLSAEIARAKGIRVGVIDFIFLLIVAASTTMTVPVVGALLMFTLMIGPPAAARAVSQRPMRALALAALFALLVIWISLGAAYLSNWPVGFFVGTLSACIYLVAILTRRLRHG